MQCGNHAEQSIPGKTADGLTADIKPCNAATDCLHLLVSSAKELYQGKKMVYKVTGPAADRVCVSDCGHHQLDILC